jgi:cobalt-zinc-cadmium resistance protein CzcA
MDFEYRIRKLITHGRVRYQLALVIYFFLLKTTLVLSQITSLTEAEAMEIAVKNHPLIQKNQSQIAQSKWLISAAKMIAPTDFFVETPQLLMGPDNSTIWTTFGAQQTIIPKKVYTQNERVLQQKVKVNEAEMAVSRHDIQHTARILYQNCLFTAEKVRYMREQDSVFREINRAAQVEAHTGNITALEKLTIESFYQQIAQQLRGAEMESTSALSELGQYLKLPQITVSQSFIKLKTTDILQKSNLPIYQLYDENIRFQQEKIAQTKLAKTPQYTVGVSQMVFNRYIPPIVRGGVSIPLWTKAYNAQVQAAEADVKVAQNEAQVIDFQLKTLYKKNENMLKLAEQHLAFYEQIGLKQADDIVQSALKIRQSGAVSTISYLQSIQQAYDLKINYLLALKAYNEAVIGIEYFKL